MRRKRRRRRQRLVAAITLTAVLAVAAIAGGYWFGSWIVDAMSQGASWFVGGSSTTGEEDSLADGGGEPAGDMQEPVEPVGFPVDNIEVAGDETLYVVQVGAYGDSQSAGRRAAELTSADFPAFVWQEGNLHRVVAAAFSKKEAADAFAKSIPGDTYVAVRSLPQNSELARLVWQEASYWSAAIENPALNSSELEHAWFRAQDAAEGKLREVSDSHLLDLRRWWADPTPANFRHAMHSFLAIIYQ